MNLGPSLSSVPEIYPTGSDCPALYLQANFIKGGLLLSFCPYHSTSDALGWTGLLRSWAKYTSAVTNGLKVAPCRSPNILDRSPLFQVNTDIALEDCHLLVKIDDVAKYLRSISQAWNAAPTNRGLSNIFNVHWYFSPRRLQALKAASHPKYEPSWVSTTAAPARGLQALKAASQPNSEEKPWLSTNDALCALLWRHITIARQLRQSPYKTTTFEISYNVRGLLSPSLDPKYVGNAYGDASTVYPIEELYSTAPDCQSLAARAVREAKNRVDNSMVEVVRLVVSG